MRVIERAIEYHSRSEVITITPLGDLHFGNAATDEQLIKRIVQQIAEDPSHFWLGGGDYCDFINRKDPRFRETAIASWLHGVNDLAGRQIQKTRDELEPIKDSCLGLLKGTHELSILKHSERDVYASLVDALKPSHDVPIRLGVQGFVRLRLTCVSSGNVRYNTWTVVIYCHHGVGGGILEGGHALALGRLFKSYNCDIGLMWHRHRRHVIDQIQLQPAKRGNKIKERYQVAAFCGAFLKSYSEDEVYAEEKHYPPQPVGPVQVILHPGTGKIAVRIPQW